MCEKKHLSHDLLIIQEVYSICQNNDALKKNKECRTLQVYIIYVKKRPEWVHDNKIIHLPDYLLTSFWAIWSFGGKSNGIGIMSESSEFCHYN